MAKGDLIIKKSNKRVQVTAAQALNFAQLAVDCGAWDGALADMARIELERDNSSQTGFSCQVSGFASIAPTDVEKVSGGVTVVRVES